jgi:hypothetical protein
VWVNGEYTAYDRQWLDFLVGGCGSILAGLFIDLLPLTPWRRLL